MSNIFVPFSCSDEVVLTHNGRDIALAKFVNKINGNVNVYCFIAISIIVLFLPTFLTDMYCNVALKEFLTRDLDIELPAVVRGDHGEKQLFSELEVGLICIKITHYCMILLALFRKLMNSCGN